MSWFHLVPDKAKIIPSFLILNQIDLESFLTRFSNNYDHGILLGYMFWKNVNKWTCMLNFVLFFHYKRTSHYMLINDLIK